MESVGVESVWVTVGKDIYMWSYTAAGRRGLAIFNPRTGRDSVPTFFGNERGGRVNYLSTDLWTSVRETTHFFIVTQGTCL